MNKFGAGDTDGRADRCRCCGEKKLRSFPILLGEDGNERTVITAGSQRYLERVTGTL